MGVILWLGVRLRTLCYPLMVARLIIIFLVIMTSIKELTEIGKEIGYKGEDLMKFIRQQQAEERDRRRLEREQRDLDRQAESELREKEKEKERLAREKDREKER